MKGIDIMNINKDVKITLNNDEQEAVRKVAIIVEEFADQNLCNNIGCCNCPLAIFCPLTDCIHGFEETLNDIANIE